MLRRIFNFFLPGLIFFCIVGGLGAFEAEPVPPDEVLRKIAGNPQVIASGVSSEREDDNSRWIRMSAGVQVCTDVPLEKLYPVITDYGNYPAIFKRNRTARVFPAEGEGVYQDVEVGIVLLGLSFVTRYRSLVIEKEHSPSRLILEFTGVSSDGSVKDTSAQWYFETVMVDGQPYTYIRYRFSTLVSRKSIFQKAIMSMFNDSEAVAMLNQLIDASKN